MEGGFPRSLYSFDGIGEGGKRIDFALLKLFRASEKVSRNHPTKRVKSRQEGRGGEKGPSRVGGRLPRGSKKEGPRGADDQVEGASTMERWPAHRKRRIQSNGGKNNPSFLHAGGERFQGQFTRKGVNPAVKGSGPRAVLGDGERAL